METVERMTSLFRPEPGEMADRKLEELAALLMDVEAAVERLPEAERQKYRDARDSVIAARRYAERHAGEHWIG